MEEGSIKTLWMKTFASLDVEGADPKLSYRPTLDRTLPFKEVLRLSANSPAKNLKKPQKAETNGHSDSSYDLLEEIGSGGMGLVHRARQNRLGREIAVKTLLSEADDENIESFVAEGMITAHLDHPNIVPVHDLVQEGDGQWMLAMKLVGGLSWRDLLHPRTPAQEKEAAKYDLQDHFQILIDVCNAVAFAHNKGIVHLDLKPENVMVGQFGEVLVMDWGLALDARSEEQREQAPLPVPHRSSITQPLGTPCYMAPELAMGKGAWIGPNTDVFLLGAILYEILSGSAPHSGPSLIMVLNAAIQCEEVEFPNPVAAELKAICRRAMAKNPKKRFRSVKAFQGALQNYLKHRESSKIAFEGKIKLEKCQRKVKKLFLKGKSQMTTTERNQIYAEYAESLAGYQQALMLWTGNKLAAQGVEDARFCYARTALDHGDLGLAESLAAKLDPEWPEARVLQRDIERESDKLKRGRVLMWLFAVGMVALAVALFFGLIFALVRVNRALESAERKGEEALDAKKLAERRQVQATKAKLEAEINRQVAQREKNAALRAREDAEASNRQAILARQKEEKQRRLAEEREKLASKRAQIAKESLDSIIDQVTEGAQGRNNRNNKVTNQTNVKLLEIALKGLERLQESEVESAGDSPAVMKAHNQIALAYFALGRYQDAVKSHKKAIALGENLLAALSLEDIDLVRQLAICYRSKARSENALGRLAEFRRDFQRSVSLLQKKQLKNDLEALKILAYTQLEWAIGEDTRFNFKEAVGHYQSAINCLERWILKRPTDMTALVNRAYAYSQMGKTKSSLGKFSEAVTSLTSGEKLWASIVRSAPTVHQYRYYWAIALHDLAVAERRDINLVRQAYGHLELAVQQLNVLVFVHRQNQYQQEYERIQRALSAWRRPR